MPSVLDQPTRRPAHRPMWAIRRVTVVLPLVPVTATVGTLGTGSDGPGPRRRAGAATGRRPPPGWARDRAGCARPGPGPRPRPRSGGPGGPAAWWRSGGAARPRAAPATLRSGRPRRPPPPPAPRAGPAAPGRPG